MRIAMIAALAASVGCSAGYDVCGPSTCEGCCTSDGECVDGTANAACGLNGLSCNDCTGVGGECILKGCHVAATRDSGEPPVYDAGTEDAGVMVTVRLTYERYDISEACPVTYSRIVCDESKVVAESRVPGLQADYAACAQSVDGGAYRFDCDNCNGFESADCVLPDGGIDHGSTPICDYPPLAVADFCAWQLP